MKLIGDKTMKIDLNSQAKEAFSTFAETGRITEDFIYHLGEINEEINQLLDRKHKLEIVEHWCRILEQSI
jgi:hypothetical protein